jgi:hypothetical protein
MESLSSKDIVAIKQGQSLYKTINILGGLSGVAITYCLRVFRSEEYAGYLLLFCVFMGHLAVSLQYKKVVDQLPYREDLGNLAEKPKSSAFWIFLLVPFSPFYFAHDLQKRIGKMVVPDNQLNVKSRHRFVDEALESRSVLSSDNSNFNLGYGIDISQAYNYLPLIKVYRQLSTLFASLVGVLMLGRLAAMSTDSVQNAILITQWFFGLIWAISMIVVCVQYFARSWSNATQLCDFNAEIGTKLKTLVYWHIFGIPVCTSVAFGILSFVFTLAVPHSQTVAVIGWSLYLITLVAGDLFVDWRRDVLLGGVFPSNVTKWRLKMQGSFVLLLVVTLLTLN